MTDTAEKAAALREALNLDRIPARDLDFCSSIVSAWEHGRASEKQAHWMGIMWERHCAPKASAPELDLSRLFTLLQEARANGLKRPFILTAGGPFDPVRLSLSRDGEAVYIVDKASDLYLGAVRDGKFLPSGKASLAASDKTALVADLAAMAADPAGKAAAYGHATGCCCFCARELTDQRSIAVGYGPICADHYGLPWGEAVAA